MNPDLLRRLQAMRPQIRARWEALLRVERLHTPLANPDTLVFLFDTTLDEVLSKLPGRRVHHAGERPKCRYESNPMRAYFPALEQALLEALIHAQAEQAADPKVISDHLAPAERTAAVTELCSTLRRIARREIAAFDKICSRAPARDRRRPAMVSAK